MSIIGIIGFSLLCLFGAIGLFASIGGVLQLTHWRSKRAMKKMSALGTELNKRG